MKDRYLKIRFLCGSLVQAFRYWKKEIWDRDIDSYYCCSGYECGCRGERIRTLLERKEY